MRAAFLTFARCRSLLPFWNQRFSIVYYQNFLIRFPLVFDSVSLYNLVNYSELHPLFPLDGYRNYSYRVFHY